MSAGTGTLVRLALRRERAIAPWWFLLLVAMSLAMVGYINRNMGTYELKLAYGAAVVVAGWVFAGVGAVAAQLARDARTATVIGLYALGLAYVLRYAADASDRPWLKVLSPLGWSHLVDAYRGDRWWWLGVSAAAAGGLCALAYTLLGRRDLGSGLLPERPGKQEAPRLRGPVALAWRLHRGLLLKWAAGTAAFAAVGGAMGPLAKDVLARPSIVVTNITTLLGVPADAALDGYMWYYLLILAYCGALYPVLMIMRLRSEETSGRAGQVQATPLTRVRWAAGHLVVAALGTAALPALAALVFSAVYAALLGDFAGTAPRFLAAALSQVPAAWCLGAVCLVAYGLLPRASVPLCWAAWILTALLGQVVAPFYGVWGGTPFEPFHYLPNIMAGQAFGTVPELTLLALTAALTAGGLLALRRRDVG